MSRIYGRSRLLREAERDQWDQQNIQYFMNDNTIFILVFDKINKDNHILTVKIQESHPFKSPDVFINGKNLIDYYGELNNALSNYKDFEKIIGKTCLCCSSIICGNNWTLNNHIIEIKNEVEEILNLRFRFVQKFWARSIASRYLIIDIPLDDFL